MDIERVGIAVWTIVFSGLVIAAQPPRTPASPTSPPPSSAPSDAKWSQPPAAASAQDVALLARAREELETGRMDVPGVLCDSTFMGLHPRKEFRELISRHAKAGPLTLCGSEEPGTRMELTLRAVDPYGNPVPNALVYIYHTSAKGWYAADGAHVQANSGDFNHARLFGYGRTDDKGELLVRTIRPGGYPDSDLPSHFHVHLDTENASGGGEVRFKDDPRMTAEYFKNRGGEEPVAVTTRKDGVQECSAEFALRRK